MNQTFKKTLYIIGLCLLIAVIFYAPQAIFSLMAVFISSLYFGLHGEIDPDTIQGNTLDAMPYFLGYVLILSSILAVVIFAIMKYINLKEAFNTRKIQWKLVPAIIVATAAGVMATNIINEQLELDDMFGAQLAAMAQNLPGMIAIAIIGPIAEEIAFRGVLISKLREKGLGPWAAILISAFVFGAVHGNPIQIPFAMVVGVMLGIIYVKTESVVLCSICHILNNSYAVIMMNIYKDKSTDMTSVDLFGSQTPVYMTLILCTILCVSFFFWYWNKK